MWQGGKLPNLPLQTDVTLADARDHAAERQGAGRTETYKSKTTLWLLVFAVAASAVILKRSQARLRTPPTPTAQVSSDGRAVEIKRGSDLEPTRVDVLDRCGDPKVGEPKIRNIRVLKSKIIATYGKHCSAEISLKTSHHRVHGMRLTGRHINRRRLSWAPSKPLQTALARRRLTPDRSADGDRTFQRALLSDVHTLGQLRPPPISLDFPGATGSGETSRRIGVSKRGLRDWITTPVSRLTPWENAFGAGAPPC